MIDRKEDHVPLTNLRILCEVVQGPRLPRARIADHEQSALFRQARDFLDCVALYLYDLSRDLDARKALMEIN
jgi:hypothetical protein